MIKLFTHTDLDGIGCAILAFCAFSEENVDVTYCNYSTINEKLKELIDMPQSFDAIFITDISPNEEIAAELDARYSNIRLLDHHSGLKYLDKYPWATIDLESCGTKLFYEELCKIECSFEDTALTRKLRDTHICSDGVFKAFVYEVFLYDTWKWVDSGKIGTLAKQMNDLLYIYQRDEFINWAMTQLYDLSESRGKYNFRAVDGYPFPRFTQRDNILLDMKDALLARQIEYANKRMIKTDLLGYHVGVVFDDGDVSSIGNALCTSNLDIDFAMIINLKAFTVQFRTVKEEIDLVPIAKKFDGGGHPKAAGAQISGHLRNILLDTLLSVKNYRSEEETE